MKVCDKHTDKKAVDTIHIQNDDAFIDVCDECKFDIMQMLSASPLEKRRGRPPKNLAQAN